MKKEKIKSLMVRRIFILFFIMEFFFLFNYYYLNQSFRHLISTIVRNRAKEIIELLSDTEKIKMERKKARANRTKYMGVSSESLSFGNANQYRGFGNDSFSGSREYYFLLLLFNQKQ